MNFSLKICTGGPKKSIGGISFSILAPPSNLAAPKSPKMAVLKHFFDRGFLRPLKSQKKSEYGFVWGISSSFGGNFLVNPPLPQQRNFRHFMSPGRHFCDFLQYFDHRFLRPLKLQNGSEYGIVWTISST